MSIEAATNASRFEEEPRFRIVTGKGGVGKTAIACALALAEAKRGKKVLLAEANGGDQVAKLLGTSPVGFEMREVLENLHVVDINPSDSIREYALLLLRFESVYKAVFENKFVRHFLRMIPSLGEMVLLGKLWFHEQEIENGKPRFDVIILDAPATGHAISMVQTPFAVEQVVPAGAMKENAQIIRSLLTDQKRTVLELVTLPEEMPVNEVKKLYHVLSEGLSLKLGHTFVNQCTEEIPQAGIEALQALPSPLFQHAAETLQEREHRRVAGEQYLNNLPAPLQKSIVRLPRLHLDTRFSIEHVRALSELIQGTLERVEDT